MRLVGRSGTPVGWGIAKVRGPLRTGVTVLVGGGSALGVTIVDGDEMEVPMYFRVFFSSVDGAAGYSGMYGAQSWRFKKQGGQNFDDEADGPFVLHHIRRKTNTYLTIFSEPVR